LIDLLEAEGTVGPENGAKGRELLKKEPAKQLEMIPVAPRPAPKEVLKEVEDDEDEGMDDVEGSGSEYYDL
jgi:hypothetical protein